MDGEKPKQAAQPRVGAAPGAKVGGSTNWKHKPSGHARGHIQVHASEPQAFLTLCQSYNNHKLPSVQKKAKAQR